MLSLELRFMFTVAPGSWIEEIQAQVLQWSCSHVALQWIGLEALLLIHHVGLPGHGQPRCVHIRPLRVSTAPNECLEEQTADLPPLFAQYDS